ncbi:MAG: Ig-like domain-containing protein [Treponema sp.]|nr:Ig-like domain-containing protein [Treponema sp.]
MKKLGKLLLLLIIPLNMLLISCPQNSEEVPNQNIPVTKIELSKTHIELSKLDNYKNSYANRDRNRVYVKLLPENATNKKIKFTGDCERDESTGKRKVGTVRSANQYSGKKPYDWFFDVFLDGEVQVGNEYTVIYQTEDGKVQSTLNITIVPVKATELILSEETLELSIGQSYSLTAEIKPNETTNKKVIWSSSDENIAKVDENGKVTVVSKEGAVSCTITATTIDGFTSTCNVKVLPVNVTGLVLSKKNLELAIGQDETLSANISPVNATNKKVTWKSSNSSVATVDVNGNVKIASSAKIDDTCTIIATTEDGGFTASCEVKVIPVRVTGIELSKTTLELNVNGSAGVYATVVPNNAVNKNITWTSSNVEVATVVGYDGGYGRISISPSAKVDDTCTITCTTEDGGFTASCTVKVVPVRVTGITFEGYDPTFDKLYLDIEIGRSKQLTAIITPENATNKKVKWSSSDTTVATVDDNGVVTIPSTAEVYKRCTITATTEDGNKKATCSVCAIPVLITSISLSEEYLILEPGESAKLFATVLPEDATHETVRWESSDTSVATVDEDGFVTAIATKGGSQCTVYAASYAYGCYSKRIPVIIKIQGTEGMKKIEMKNKSFKMGSDLIVSALTAAKPVHEVSFTRDILICDHEVTKKEWLEVFSSYNIQSYADTPKDNKDNIPIYDINWCYAITYCNKRSIIEGLEPCYSVQTWNSGVRNEVDWLAHEPDFIPSDSNEFHLYEWKEITCDFTKNGYRFPTEAEWEYCARGGITDTDKIVWAGTTDAYEVWKYARYNYAESFPGKRLLPNAYDLYDMSGNVSEMCWGNYVYNEPNDNYQEIVNLAKKYEIPLRGGNYEAKDREYVSVTSRWEGSADYTYNGRGFRVVRTVVE